MITKHLPLRPHGVPDSASARRPSPRRLVSAGWPSSQPTSPASALTPRTTSSVDLADSFATLDRRAVNLSSARRPPSVRRSSLGAVDRFDLPKCDSGSAAASPSRYSAAHSRARDADVARRRRSHRLESRCRRPARTPGRTPASSGSRSADLGKPQSRTSQSRRFPSRQQRWRSGRASAGVSGSMPPPWRGSREPAKSHGPRRRPSWCSRYLG